MNKNLILVFLIFNLIQLVIGELFIYEKPLPNKLNHV